MVTFYWPTLYMVVSMPLILAISLPNISKPSYPVGFSYSIQYILQSQTNLQFFCILFVLYYASPLPLLCRFCQKCRLIFVKKSHVSREGLILHTTSIIFSFFSSENIYFSEQFSTFLKPYQANSSCYCRFTFE